MKRSILLSLLVIGAAVALIGGASVATFHDTETTAGGLVTGSLNLQVGVTEGGVENCEYVDPLPSPSFFVLNAKPGDVFEKTFCVWNDGTIAGDLTAAVLGASDMEVGCNEPEAEAEGGDCFGVPDLLGDGELSENLHLEIWRDLDCMNDFDPEDDTLLWAGPLDPIVGVPLPVIEGPMTGNEERCYALQGTVNGGNEVQTDQVMADIIYDLTQAP